MLISFEWFMIFGLFFTFSIEERNARRNDKISNNIPLHRNKRYEVEGSGSRTLSPDEVAEIKDVLQQLLGHRVTHTRNFVTTRTKTLNMTTRITVDTVKLKPKKLMLRDKLTTKVQRSRKPHRTRRKLIRSSTKKKLLRTQNNYPSFRDPSELVDYDVFHVASTVKRDNTVKPTKTVKGYTQKKYNFADGLEEEAGTEYFADENSLDDSDSKITVKKHKYLGNKQRNDYPKRSKRPKNRMFSQEEHYSIQEKQTSTLLRTTRKDIKVPTKSSEVIISMFPKRTSSRKITKSSKYRPVVRQEEGSITLPPIPPVKDIHKEDLPAHIGQEDLKKLEEVAHSLPVNQDVMDKINSLTTVVNEKNPITTVVIEAYDDVPSPTTTVKVTVETQLTTQPITTTVTSKKKKEDKPKSSEEEQDSDDESSEEKPKKKKTTEKPKRTSKKTKTTEPDSYEYEEPTKKRRTTKSRRTRSRRIRTQTTTELTTTHTCPTYKRHPMLDVAKVLDIIMNLTREFRLSEKLNASLHTLSLPTCWTTTTTTEMTTPYQESNDTGMIIAKCFHCGMDVEGIPRSAPCADAFAGDFLPLLPIDATARGQVAKYRKYCKWENVTRWHVNETDRRSIYGRWTGGCSVRWIDLSGVYTQRTCRNKRRAAMGKHYASKRMAKLEMALMSVEDGCIGSPVAVLLPFSRGISLYARFHACVCSTHWCNAGVTRWPTWWLVMCGFLVLWMNSPG